MNPAIHIPDDVPSDEWKKSDVFRYRPTLKSVIVSGLDAVFSEIKGTVETLAHSIFNQRVEASWALQPVVIDVGGKPVRMHDYMGVLSPTPAPHHSGVGGLGAGGMGVGAFDTHIYAPVITIPLPMGMRSTDKRVTLLRDALLYDETGEFKGPLGVPFRRNSAYREFTLEFTAQVPDAEIPGRSLWWPSTYVYLPDPRTVFAYGYEPQFTQHRTDVTKHVANDLILRDWAREFRRAREAVESGNGNGNGNGSLQMSWKGSSLVMDY
ncbi:uncharacterized protein GGS25DRAFT_498419 [Hypoxylon fragiforme]|uniref:uncharacterized protein n=1 Tax=Hypoxylon fragiforme TaxID=63214 RepID=UPI0020C6EB3F|nr:uncharacterized protein GGS25DRAFT_498419 [Hypoxylon fragiforme]KAI2605875.1 hypothetical protein GGS25DRAFT_498419 [Hypoxylon fragiforme]